MRGTVLRLMVLWISLAGALPLPAAEPNAAGIEFFEKKIRPVLVKHCYECHSASTKSVKGGLRVDHRDGLLRGGESGPSLIANKPDESLLLKALKYDGLEMPPQGRLPDEVIADFRKWIELGAPDPRVDSASSNEAQPTTKIDFVAGKKFWAFQSPSRHVPPKVARPEWVSRASDLFVLAKLDEARIEPNRMADRRTLIRRLNFDLIGLPPTPDDVEEFVSDDSPDAFERLVDRQLASPQFGEKWARLWLDISRYAEDQAHIVGNDRSLCFPNAYLYRDWVISALNSDLPFDQFVKWQLAADAIAPEDQSQRAALGFIGLGPKYYRRNSPEVMAEEWEDRVDVVSRGLLGLTVACARCHDHKYDPIATEDYYALAGVFASTEMFNQPLAGAETDDKTGQAKKAENAMHILRDTKPVDLNVQVRGDVTRKGPVVPRRFLRILSDAEPRSLTTGSGRLDLAEAIVDRRNPLTARVFVNRVWAVLIGRPLVASPSNFGMLGQRPTHPELLDDLAVRFMESGWSIKWLVREIVSSSAWKQASEHDERTANSETAPSVDSENRLLSRMNRRRLEIEQWRDSVLFVSGRLSPTLFGTSIEPEKPDETRRTLYSRISRLELNPLLARFDFPDPNAHSDRRVHTTTPLQKLFVLNSPFMLTQAERLVARVATASDSTAGRVYQAYALLFGRTPTAEELKLATDFVDEPNADSTTRWLEYLQVLLASNEFLMVD